MQPLAELGVHKIFTPGATTVEIVEWVRANVGDASATEAPDTAGTTQDA
jgi:methylmalonyl-CoA mutase C-terminal domain/subunit